MKFQDPIRVRNVLNRAGSDLGNLNAAAKTIQSYNALLDSVLDNRLRPHVTVANLRDGQLILLADSPVWASRARLQLAEIQQAIARDRSRPQVTGVRIITRPGSIPAPASAPRRAEISETTRKLLNDVAEGTDNPGLRDALQRLARRES